MLNHSVTLVRADDVVVNVPAGVPVVVSTAPRVTATLYDDLLVVRNTGAPDRFRIQDAVPEPFYFRSVVYRPDPAELRIPQLTPFDGSARNPDGSWTLVSEDSFKHAHHEAADPAQPWYAPSSSSHMLDGGDALVFRLVRPGDPYETDRAAADGFVRKLNALDVLSYDQTLLERYPLARANLDLYRFTARSASGQGVADFGRYLIPEHFVAKYTSWPRELLSGWYGFSDHQLPGDGHCNVHYGHAGHWLASYLVSRDPLSRAVGLWLVRAKCALGLVDTDVPQARNWTAGAWRGEKAGRGRRGSGLGPDSAKEWDYDLLAALALEPADPVFLRALETRRNRLLTVPFATVWNGAGGGRRAGNYLRNLLDHRRYALTVGDSATSGAFVARASAFARHVFSVQRKAASAWFAKYRTPMFWFHNSYVPGRMKAWEESALYVALADLDSVAPLPADDAAMLDEMLVWLCANGTRVGPVLSPTGTVVAAGDFVQVAYEVGVDPTAAPYFFASTPANSLWHVPVSRVVNGRNVPRPDWYYSPLDWRNARLVDEAFRYVGRTWQTIGAGRIAPAALAVENNGEGPGSHKMRAYAALALRTFSP